MESSWDLCQGLLRYVPLPWVIFYYGFADTCITVDDIPVLPQAAVSGLQNQPIINAVIDGDDIIYRDYVDIC